MPEPDTRLLTYLKAFSADMLTGMSGSLSVPFAALALWVSSRSQKILWGCLAVICGVYGSYRVWRNERKSASAQLEALGLARDQEIESLRLAKDEEIESLKVERDALKQRPYDAEHKHLAESKVNKLSEVSRDLVSYLLHYGETESNELLRRCKHQPEFNDAVQRAREASLVLDVRTGSAAQGTERYSWKTNPKFEIVLQDLLGNRKTVYF
jgi:hypothetical protein